MLKKLAPACPMISAARNAQALVEARPGRAQLAFYEAGALSRWDSAHMLAERGIRDLRHGCDAKCRPQVTQGFM